MKAYLDTLIEVRMPILDEEFLQRHVMSKDLDKRISQSLSANSSLLFIELCIEDLLLNIAMSDSNFKVCDSGVKLHVLNHEEELVKADLKDVRSKIDW